MCKIIISFFSHLETCKVNSFKIGMGSAFSIGGNYFSILNRPLSHRFDRMSMYSDWEQVGKDIMASRDEFVKENKNVFAE